MMEECDEILTPQEKADIMNYNIPSDMPEIEKRLKDGLLFAKKRRTLIALLLASALRGNFQGDREAWRKWVKNIPLNGKKDSSRLVCLGEMIMDAKPLNKPLYNFFLKLSSDKLMALTTIYNDEKRYHKISEIINFCNGARVEVIERVERAELYRMIHVFLGKKIQENKPVEQPELPGFDKILGGVLQIGGSGLAKSVTDSEKAGLYINSGLQIFAAGLEYFKTQPKDRGILKLDSLELELQNELQQIAALKREAARG